MKKARIVLVRLLCLVFFFCNCSSEKEEDEDSLLRVKTIANVCVTHEGAPVGAGVIIWFLLLEDDFVYLETQNLTTDESGCTSLVTPYYDLCDSCFFHFHAAVMVPSVTSFQNVYLNFAEAAAGAVESDDGQGKIYTWNINLVLNY